MMTEDQRFLLDTFGYFIVADAITSTQVAALKATLHHPTEQWEPLDKAEGPLHWDVIWRDLLDLPGLSPILEELIGDPALIAGRQVAAEPVARLLPADVRRVCQYRP